MKFIRFAILAAPALYSHAFAGLLAYESFDYKLGDTLAPWDRSKFGLNGGTGWSQGWNNNYSNELTITQGLQYAGLATSGNAFSNLGYSWGQPGLHKAIGTTGRTLADASTSTDTWFSFLLRPDDSRAVVDAPNAPLDGGVAWGGVVLNSSTGSVFIGRPGGQNAYALQSGQDNSIAASTVAPVVGTTDLLVVHIDASSKVSLWVDPKVGSPLGTASVTRSDLTVGPGLTNLWETDSGFWTMDEFRVGTSAADVLPQATPEPATLAALGLGAVALLRRRSK